MLVKKKNSTQLARDSNENFLLIKWLLEEAQGHKRIKAIGVRSGSARWVKGFHK